MLALGEREEAYELMPPVLASGDLSADERLRYRALHATLELVLCSEDPRPYRRALVQYYGEETVSAAEAWVEGEVRFPGLGKLDAAAPTEGHRRLLEAYRKVLTGQQR